MDQTRFLLPDRGQSFLRSWESASHCTRAHTHTRSRLFSNLLGTFHRLLLESIIFLYRECNRPHKFYISNKTLITMTQVYFVGCPFIGWHQSLLGHCHWDDLEKVDWMPINLNSRFLLWILFTWSLAKLDLPSLFHSLHMSSVHKSSSSIQIQILFLEYHSYIYYLTLDTLWQQ